MPSHPQILCPACKSLIHAEAIICPHCRSKISRTLYGETKATQPRESSGMGCVGCLAALMILVTLFIFPPLGGAMLLAAIIYAVVKLCRS